MGAEWRMAEAFRSTLHFFFSSFTFMIDSLNANILPINRRARNRYQFLRKLCVAVNESIRTYVKLLADESMHIVWREWIDFECFYMTTECTVNSQHRGMPCWRDCGHMSASAWFGTEMGKPSVPLQHSPNDYSIDIYRWADSVVVAVIVSQCHYRIHKHYQFIAKQLQARGGRQQRKSPRSINY